MFRLEFKDWCYGMEALSLKTAPTASKVSSPVHSLLTLVPDVMTVILSIFMSAMGLGQSSAFAPNVGKARVAAAEIFEIIDRVPPIDSSSTVSEPQFWMKFY